MKECVRMSRVETGGLLVAPILHDFIEKEALPDTGVESAASWAMAILGAWRPSR